MLLNIICKRQRAAVLLAGALLYLGIGIGAFADAYASKVHTVTHIVTIKGMQFSPNSIEVKAGDTVIWQNKDIVNHNAVADNKDFNSGDIPVNSAWRFVTRKKGTFPYTCTLHPTMKGTLVVK